MDITLIETFLRVVNSRSISQAARHLYVSQSTVSTRLQQLEKELGSALLERKKGRSGMELTSKGQAFVPIAQQWMRLGKTTDQFIRSQPRLALSIAAPSSLTQYLFPPLYQMLLNLDPPTHLTMQTYHSDVIFNQVDQHKTDFGFVFYHSSYSNIVSTPVLREKMMLICSAAGSWPERAIHPSELDPTQELYIEWSPDITLWHDNWFNPNILSYSVAHCPFQIPFFMDNPQSWAICPTSVAKTLEQNPRMLVRELAGAPPDRTFYMLTRRADNKNPPPQHKLFLEQFEIFRRNLTDLECL